MKPPLSISMRTEAAVGGKTFAVVETERVTLASGVVICDSREQCDALWIALHLAKKWRDACDAIYAELEPVLCELAGGAA